MRVFLSLGFLAFALSAATLPGDADRGKEVFRTERCVTCHSVNGEGGKLAPDLGKATGRDLTPSTMAGLMWNHAPAMWSAMQKANVQMPELTQQEAADLFAFFYASRYFDRPGDAGRGKQVFASKRCADCHDLSGAGREGARPVSEWQSLADPIALADAMWNHAPQMMAAFKRKNVPHPQVTSQELTDLRLYLQNLPKGRRETPRFSPASANTGQDLFQAKGCAGCHKNNLATRPGRRSLTDFAAAMWNHAGQMGPKPAALDYQEMRRLVGYLWSLQFFDDRGDAARGKQVFARKNCASCHGVPSSGAPNLAQSAGKLYAFDMVHELWLHGPAMLDKMREKKLAWPRFSGTEMADLTAYLNQGHPGAGAGR